MSGLVPDKPDVDAAYWVSRDGGGPVFAKWHAESRTWWIENWHITVSPESMGFAGYTFARVGDTECRHPIPGPAALMRMHALPQEMIDRQNADLKAAGAPLREHGPWVFATRDCAAMLKEAMK